MIRIITWVIAATIAGSIALVSALAVSGIIRRKPPICRSCQHLIVENRRPYSDFRFHCSERRGFNWPPVYCCYYKPINKEPEEEPKKPSKKPSGSEYISFDAISEKLMKLEASLTDSVYRSMSASDGIVHCKDCKYGMDTPLHCYKGGIRQTRPEDYCSRGERKK